MCNMTKSIQVFTESFKVSERSESNLLTFWETYTWNFFGTPAIKYGSHPCKWR